MEFKYFLRLMLDLIWSFLAANQGSCKNYRSKNYEG